MSPGGRWIKADVEVWWSFPTVTTWFVVYFLHRLPGRPSRRGRHSRELLDVGLLVGRVLALVLRLLVRTVFLSLYQHHRLDHHPQTLQEWWRKDEEVRNVQFTWLHFTFIAVAMYKYTLTKYRLARSAIRSFAVRSQTVFQLVGHYSEGAQTIKPAVQLLWQWWTHSLRPEMQTFEELSVWEEHRSTLHLLVLNERIPLWSAGEQQNAGCRVWSFGIHLLRLSFPTGPF